jgi:hypothetical protein
MTVLLSVLLSLVLWASYIAVAYGFGAIANADLDRAFIVATAYLAVLCVPLVVLAYPPGERRWWRFVVWPLLGLFAGIIPLVWLPWRIVSRRRSTL